MDNNVRDIKDSLIQLIDSMSYSIGKLSSSFLISREIVDIDFYDIKHIIEEIKLKVGNNFEGEGFKDIFRRIDYILSRLEEWIQNEKIYENLDAEIFLDSFSDRLRELKSILS